MATKRRSVDNVTKNLRIETLEDRRLLTTTPIQLTIENLADEGGLANTPVWVGFHNGRFDIGTLGRSADGFPGLEKLAEEGDTSELSADFQARTNGTDSTVLAPGGFSGAPIFDPDETVTTVIDVEDPGENRYFSFASMLIPSNDAFIGNLNARAYQLFNRSGRFRGPITIDIYGSDVWDAGTEVNNPQGGAAFSTEGGSGVDENGVIHRHTGLDDFIGTGTPIGALEAAFTPETPIARITLSLADDPSDPIDRAGPRATAEADDVEEGGGDSHEIQVTYTDPSGVDPDSLDPTDLRIVAHRGRRPVILQPTSVETDVESGELPRTLVATYTIPAPGGDFDAGDNGRYHIFARRGAVEDGVGNRNAFRRIGDFNVDIAAEPVELHIEIENLSPSGGLSQTPFWVGFHDGTFDLGSLYRSADRFGGLETLAEEGGTGEVSDRFLEESDGVDATIVAPDGFPGAPIFEPGEVVAEYIEVVDPQENRYISFASMVIPSNDAFIANLNARAYRLFDSNGNFRGPRTIVVYGSEVWDAGTEVNDPFGGAAFSTEGGDGEEENGRIGRHAGLDDFIGTGTPIGELESAFGRNTPIARITVSLAGDPSGPIDNTGPKALLEAESVTEAGGEAHQIQVTYNDPSGVDVDSIDPTDLTIIRRGRDRLFLQPAEVETESNSNGTTVVATYTVPAPDGEFDSADNGRYTVYLRRGSVDDGVGNSNVFRRLGSFNVNVEAEPVALQIEVENLAEEGGLFQTPFWVGFHNGRFQVARHGQSAARFPGLEELAEEGDTSVLSASFNSRTDGVDATILAPEGFPGAPIFDPGETALHTIEVTDPTENRYFSFASMVIPSNDAFLANLNSRAYQVFNRRGEFRGPITIELYGRDVWDAGTEVNDPSGGAAFSTEGGESADQRGRIRRHPGLDDFVGTGTPAGALESAFDSRTPIARITISKIDLPS